MAKKQKSGQEPTDAAPKKRTQKRLSWRDERFIEEYVRNGGNATAAARALYIPHPNASGPRLLLRVSIQEGIERRKEELRRLLGFNRNDALAILVGMATASNSDFVDVYRDPANKENYRRLGDKRYAMESAKKTITFTENGGEKETTEIRIISPGERRNVINDLWEKLGLDKDASEGDRVSFLERFAQLGSKLGRSGSGGGSPGPEGSP